MAETQKRTAQEETLEKGPFGLLTITVSHNTQVLIELRNNRKLLGRVKAFDRHMNMILENVTEMWTEIPKGNKGKKAHATNKERFIPKMFLRGDSVIYILRNPK
ncbi:unnamed protein product [Paramecium primaurelia]|uniref:Small nuclear ribonucleoprotein Sm D2 n=5 Tax=Paramecium TaxID=5884 RepID=A0DTA1_PARTE|nr:uncharacterized protein GSPATT00019961001 [Paramecium tetraurelia]CAD8060931.1 unnamed protein product [Paramecium primaurelia]CAD8081231.1 unnamed protein product [Paramecium sonneborni]CAD8151815.1 unnamed protein product [Paramecium octaurelia]CAD8209861.1 unnamed protein product [Paramecium pentaurelia]CAD8087164.1 unnamed protein product [Paramecium sonneborni]|eukprot:XP_001453665.1 hypothetical protein (macronuclear) [Paramecium tetraurelia strain d4-2]